jgi:hypothetical protein
MGLGGICDFWRSSGSYELFEDIFASRIIYHGIELSVRKSPGSSFSELDI